MSVLSDITAVHIGHDGITFIETKDAVLYEPLDTQCAFLYLDGGHHLRIAVRDGRVVRQTTAPREPSELRIERDVPIVNEDGLSDLDGQQETIEVLSGVRIGDRLLIKSAPGYPWSPWGAVEYIATII